MIKIFPKLIIQIIFLLLCSLSFAQQTVVKYLSGLDKDHTVQWDFFCTDGRNSGKWSKIPVPSNWEMQNYGTYNYGHDKVKGNESGIYKHDFFVGDWKNKRVFIVFDGSTTDTKVMVNDKQVGPIHQGGFYQFKYDITDFLKFNSENALEVRVDKTSANLSINNAERKGDFWIFGGIFRPVYLEIVPEVFIERLAIDAKADGTFKADVYTKNLKGDELIEAQVQMLNGHNVGGPIRTNLKQNQELQTLSGKFNNPLLWNAEFPNLYQVSISIRNKSGVIHKIIKKFGFRTVEVRLNDGLYVNGNKIMLKGSNRHSFWPETGRTLSYGVHLLDVKLMKEMNMNAVRMSHYPPDVDFLNICDSLGLYVIDELTGWQAKYDNEVGHRLVKELVLRDVNHPSILFWANGNEGGFNTDLDKDYALYDPQNRVVIHPWEKFNGTDTKHYPDYNYMVKAAQTGKEVFFPTEFMHGLYDGGASAALDDFWNQMLKHPHGAGGFIWAFLDESVIRTDKNGIYDSDGNHAPDGILGPHREKEASFFSIKEIWSPIYIAQKEIDKNFDGKLELENRFSFTNLNQCTFKWRLAKFPSAKSQSLVSKITATGNISSPDIKPNGKGKLDLVLPVSWKNNDVLYLSAFGVDGKEIFTWSWKVKPVKAIVAAFVVKSLKSKITVDDKTELIKVVCDGIGYFFDKTTGYIQQVNKGVKVISLSNGPVLAGMDTSLQHFSSHFDGDRYIIEASYGGMASLNVKWIFSAGKPAKLEYSYNQTGDVDFSGITFNYPENKITGIKYLGRGPYRVWKNRLKGQQIGVWHKDYNNTITGETWRYPEFKGYHAEVNWVVIENKESPFTVYTTNENVFLQMFQPDREKDALKNNNVEPAFPKGNIGFLNSISPIGTKFQSAGVMGPQSEKNHLDGKLITGDLYFDFSN
ncbi:glycoside hydrolase family 2 [Pedobacter frigidisoli]|uniref:beta-galactosidase n=1 Tax=Pedobacter frigidisoli TaxID=2530455 RepID=A0A4R0P6Q5_9SPHI|nr:glycoside hydrolase family 2 TIM barrel-domain containing protein [Pedobacter frigidisoli]TCD11576.1 glycoside hydrolase family 2 [Pedobacter frigidisoli]